MVLLTGGRACRVVVVVPLLLLLALVVPAPAPASGQSVAMELSVDPLFPASMVVGQAGDAQLRITSVAAGGTLAVEVTALTLNPACGSLALDCPLPDPGTILLSPTAVGLSGACAGRPYTVVGPDAAGRSVFLPSTPVVLDPPGQPGSTCLLGFTFTVRKMPAFDALPTSPGAQTAHVATVAGSGRVGTQLTGQTVGRASQVSNILSAPDGTYRPLSPARILDTRDGTGGLNGPLAPASSAEVQITGQGGVPVSGVSAVVLNVTVTQPTAAGFLTLFPADSPLPLASNLNFNPGQNVPNLVVVRVGANGRVGAYNSSGSTHVIFDVAGWFSDTNAGNAGHYRPLPPARILDTRNGIRLGPNSSLELQVAGAGGVPATGVDAAVLDIVATETGATSFVTAYPTGSAQPGVSNLNFDAGDTVANRAVVKLGYGGKVTIYNLAGDADIVVDVGGWFTDTSAPATGGTFVATQPARILDTRDATGGVVGILPAGAGVEVQVTGRGGVPASGVGAVVLNLTATEPAAAGFLTVFPSGTALPLASDLNVEAGETRPNLAIVQVGAGGKVTIYASTTTHVVLDVEGWFLG
jgi:hypothetical protein